MSIEIFYGNPVGERVLPNGRVLKLEMLPDFEKLEEQQQVWMAFYIDNFPSKTFACVEAGVTKYTLESWNVDPIFYGVKSMIEDLMKETLSVVHFEEAKENSKIRGTVLTALDTEGYRKKETQHNHLHVGSSGDLFSLLQATSAKKS